jgi:MraZ protein
VEVKGMFMGEYAHNIDKKGRIIIPAKLREELGDHVIITRGLDGCLAVYTKEQWETIYEQLMKLPSTKKDARMFVRMMTSKAAECEIDAQGRVLIPSPLVKLAELVKECMVIGAANHVEIWSRERWEPVDEEANDAFEDIAESLTEFMI